MRDLFEKGNILDRPFEAVKFEKNKYNFPVPAHWHYYTEMVFVLTGTAIVKCNSTEYILNPGNFILFFPQVIHSVMQKGSEELSFYVLKFDINRLDFKTDYIPRFKYILKEAASQTCQQIVFHESEFTPGIIRGFFEECIYEVSHRSYGYDSKVQCVLSLMLIEVIRRWMEKGFSPSYSPDNAIEDYSIHDILIYIEQNIQNPIHIESLAEMCNMSYSYFAKTFRELYGQSCKDYIEFVRLSKAENLLLFTNADLTYISTETGFSDCSHFIRVFKKKYGTTPKQFRAQMLKETTMN